MARERRRIEYSPFDAEKISHRHFEVMRINDGLDEGSYKLKIINLDLSEYDFPSNAELSVAVRKGVENLKIVNIGHVAHHPEELLEFTVDFENKSGQLVCRLNATPDDEIYFLGFSDWRHPTHSKNKGLFDIRDEDLGDLIWNFEIPQEDTAKPSLIWNNQIPNLMALISGQNILLHSTILPTALKMGYEHIVKDFEGIRLEDYWQHLWWEFAKKFMEDAHIITESEDPEEKINWCFRLIKKICGEQEYKEAFIQSLRSEEDVYEED